MLFATDRGFEHEPELDPMTVWIYVNSSKQVGDPDHLKLFARVDAADTWLQETTRKALRSSMRF